MAQKFLRKYNAAATVDFALYQPDGVDLEPAATFAAGDLKIMKDEGAEANTTNLPTDEGQGYSLVLTATELQAARVVVYIVDQTGSKVWLDDYLVVESYGNASAQHAFDLDTATQTVDVSATGVDAIWDEDIVAAHGTADTAGLLMRALGAVISQRTNNATLNALLGVADTASTDLPEQVWAETVRTLTSLGTDVVNADALAADAVAEIADGVWDEDVVAAHGTADTSGLLMRALGAVISQRTNNATLNALLGVADTASTDLPEQVWTETVRTLTSLGAGEIADQVWDELIAGHNTASTFGNALQSITNGGIADAIWDEVIEAGANANSQTARQILRIVVAALVGITASEGDWSAKSIDEAKTRIAGTLTAAGFRSSVTTLDGS